MLFLNTRFVFQMFLFPRNIFYAVCSTEAPSTLNIHDLQEFCFVFQSKIRELEKKAEAQNLRYEELIIEMQSLKKPVTNGSPKNAFLRFESLTPDSGDMTPGEFCSDFWSCSFWH